MKLNPTALARVIAVWVTILPIQVAHLSTPFENDTGKEYYDAAAAGLGDFTACLLNRHGRISMVKRQRLTEIPEKTAKGLEDLRGAEYATKAAKLFLAQAALTGRLVLKNGMLRVHSQIVDAETGKVLASEEMPCKISSMLETALKTARGLASQMDLALQDRDLKRIGKTPIASFHFIEGIQHCYEGRLDEAIMRFMQAEDLDSDYTETHFWAGVCYLKLGEEDHAAIEFSSFLKDEPRSRYAGEVRKLLKKLLEREDVISPWRRLFRNQDLRKKNRL